MEEQLVSIITPAYNCEHFIAETIESVLKQTHSSFEMLIVDDKSKDGTKEVIQKFAQQDSRITLIEAEENLGPAGARNLALAKAKGRYIAFLDSDDLWKPEKLARQVQFLQETNCGFCFASFRRMSEDGSLVSEPLKVPPSMTYNDLLKNTAIGTLTVLLDRKVVGTPHAPLNVGYDDFAMWLSILRKGVVARSIADDLALYRIMNKSVSSNKVRAAKWFWGIVRKLEKQNIFKASYYISCYFINGIFKESTRLEISRSSIS